MKEAASDKSKPRRGRPSTGKAKTATQRSQERDKAFLEAGGKIINRLRLSPEAAAALARQAERYPDEKTAILGPTADRRKSALSRLDNRHF